MKLLLRVAYRGSAYHGFQVQPNAVTVQEKLQDAAEILYGKRYDLTGCSRTDAGVHAERFYCTLSAGAESARIATERVPLAWNRFLPPDIAVQAAQIVPDEFHPRYAVREKEYRYLLRFSRIRDPFYTDLAYTVPFEPDVEAMRQAAALLCGTHDYASFMASGSSVCDTVRTVHRFTVTQDGVFTELKVAADGFLYNMVRILIGTLLGISRGIYRPSDMPKILAAKDRALAGETAPPHGLYLHRVVYGKEILI